MHWTTHIVTGAILGYLVDRPAASAVAGLGSHFVLDVMPHYDPDNDASYVIDGLLGASVLACLGASPAVKSFNPSRSAFWGAFGAAAPDLELMVNLVKEVEGPGEYLLPSHDGTLPHLQAGPWVSTVWQVGLCLLLLAIAARKRRLETVRRGSAADAPSG